jgi:hypothetical protein
MIQRSRMCGTRSRSLLMSRDLCAPAAPVACSLAAAHRCFSLLLLPLRALVCCCVLLYVGFIILKSRLVSNVGSQGANAPCSPLLPVLATAASAAVAASATYLALSAPPVAAAAGFFSVTTGAFLGLSLMKGRNVRPPMKGTSTSGTFTPSAVCNERANNNQTILHT